MDEKWAGVKVKVHREVAKLWHDSTIHCYLTNKDCSTCEVSLLYGYNKNSINKPCKMPQAVQILLDKGKKPPMMKLRQFKEGLYNGKKI